MAATAVQDKTIYTLELDPDMWAEHIAHQRALRVRGWKEPKGFEFQVDGQVYGPIPPGGTIRLQGSDDVRVAMEQSMLFEREQLEDGTRSVHLDKNSSPSPMLKIIGKMELTREAEMSGGAVSMNAPKCPFCQKPFEDQEEFKKHLLGHVAGETAKPGSQRTKPAEELPIHAPIEGGDAGIGKVEDAKPSPKDILLQHAPKKD